MDYQVRVIDKLLRFDTTNDDVIATLLPFEQTPNAPYEVHKTSVGDGHTVTIQVDPSTFDFLLPDGSTSVVLDDASNWAIIKIPADGLSPAFVTMGGSGGGSGGGGGGGLPAPPVTIFGSADVIFRSDHRVEVDLDWIANAAATARNFLGVAIYLEDPDISSGANHPLDGGSMPLDGTAQVSGEWAPVRVNDSTESPAVLFLDSTMGATSGQTYRRGRDVRIYLAAYGPSSHPHLVRATDTTETPTPNILVYIPQGRSQGESGQEWAFLVTNVHVAVNTDYNRLVPQYDLTLRYTPPDPTVPVPPGINHFGGCRIVFVQENDSQDPIFPGSDTGMSIPVAQADTGFKSDVYEPSPGGGKFRVYFCSEDDSQPLGSHINSLVEGTTPYAYAIVPPVPTTPDITGFSIGNQQTRWFQDGSMVAHADFAWHLPDVSNNIRYAGVYLYLVKVTGSGSKLTVFPKDLTGPQSNVAVNWPMDISDIPDPPEVWTIAAISYDLNGKLADDPKKYGTSSFHSPTVTWNIGPPTPGSAGSGQEHAPFVTINAGASVSDTQTLSSDGVRMVTFSVGSWTNPTDNQFGNAQVAMVINHDPTKPTFWTVPSNATSFQTPAIPSFGNIGSPVAVDFYVVSDDPQGQKNSLQPSVTPKISYNYTPTSGAIIPARSGWFDESQFSWVTGVGLQADNIEAKNIYVGKTLVVGGAPDTSFAGQSNGQIAVKNSAGTLRAWMGEQQPNQGMSGPPLWGAWFGQIWIGGTNPLDAPLWIDIQGIIQVGGIAARQGSRYPYISIRDQTGLEMGRIGASLNAASGSVGDNVGPSPPAQLTAGAWFTQLAVGGSNLSNWNILIVPDTTRPLGSQFLMRNIGLLSIDYPSQQLVQPYNAAYKMEFGDSVWMAGGLTSGTWRFPGIHIYEVDNIGNNFGATFLSRGMVLRGTQSQNYAPLVSLVTYNGAPSGIDNPALFWGELAMYSSFSPFGQTVYLASGAATHGNPLFYMLDVSGNLLFRVNSNGDTAVAGVLQGAPGAGGATTPINAYAYNVSGYGTVIDAAGNWRGRAIATGALQTPWMSPINGAGFALTNAGNISAAQYLVNASGNPVIDGNGAFLGSGVNVHSGGIACGGLNTSGGNAPSGFNTIDTGTLNVSTAVANNYQIQGHGVAINSFGQFVGQGVNVGGNGIGCGALSTYSGAAPTTANSIDTVHLIAGGNVTAQGNITANGHYGGGAFQGAGVDVNNNGIGCGSITVRGPDNANGTAACSVNGTVNCAKLQIGGTQRIDTFGIYRGSLQFYDHVYAQDFGIQGLYVGWNGGFYDRDGVYHVVRGGIITTN